MINALFRNADPPIPDRAAPGRLVRPIIAAVGCARCGAEPGERCRTADGRSAEPHLVRRRAAQSVCTWAQPITGWWSGPDGWQVPHTCSSVPVGCSACHCNAGCSMTACRQCGAAPCPACCAEYAWSICGTAAA